ncbi:hypothetical protein [Mesorhizobium japonicum]|uniref:Mll2306 protein n=3 Tax=Mesorhizobium TaxID=68287 RepID=Q98IP9_RHILO|nr:mll2306 [Mesorhizobium japonicum MAFF 303099]
MEIRHTKTACKRKLKLAEVAQKAYRLGKLIPSSSMKGGIMPDQDALIRAAIGRLLSEKTGVAVISMRETITELLAITGAALTVETLQDMLLEMAEVRGMTVVLDV